MNIFARGLGGYVSDLANQKWGMPGRLWVQTIFLAGQGAFVLIFANTKSLAGAILIMVLFSSFVQAAQGMYFSNVTLKKLHNTASLNVVIHLHIDDID
jgi:MFS transporter, NNP family, nitrate/nitrite transporter